MRTWKAPASARPALTMASAPEWLVPSMVRLGMPSTGALLVPANDMIGVRQRARTASRAKLLVNRIVCSSFGGNLVVESEALTGRDKRSRCASGDGVRWSGRKRARGQRMGEIETARRDWRARFTLAERLHERGAIAVRAWS